MRTRRTRAGTARMGHTRRGPARRRDDTRRTLRRLVHDRLRTRVTTADAPRRQARVECVGARKRWDA
ncbi:hypothetical protein CYJ73_20680 [Gordonia terrae]|uniref:Uncharacterized protein n=1 Tax=Gordonia terrae TaxID=2055 RepID=A0A2I1R3D7_9ACTN|nr:hypothetical protein CYJ73_20680 [Gordonia terrae]